MVAAAAIAFAVGCEGEVVSTKSNFTPTIYIDDITETTAKVKVTHNGDKNDSWYGLLTTDVETDVNEMVKTAVKMFLMGQGYENLHTSNRYVEVLKPLAPGTQYRYIVFGMDSDGKSYGQVAEQIFKTMNYGNIDTSDMTYNNSWLVQYTGAGTLYEQQYDHIVSVLSNDSNSYAITVVEADTYNPEGLMELATDFRNAMVQYLNNFNATNATSYTFADLLFTGNAADAFDLGAGRYRAVVLGYSFSGEVTGLYAVSEPFEVSAPIASSAYNSWLGTWTITGFNNVESIIELSAGKPNETCFMTGWEGFEQWPVRVDYESSLDSMFFSAQLISEDTQITDTKRGALYLLGGDDDGYFYSTDEGDYEIAIAGILDDGARAIVRYGVNMSGYPKFVQMFYMAKIDGKYYSLTPEDEIPTFISMMTAGARPRNLVQVESTVRNRFVKLSSKGISRKYRLTPIPDSRIK